MIYSYKEIDHDIYYFHENIAFIFRQMFENNLPEYNEKILVHPSFIAIINSAKKSILEPLKELVEIYYKLPFADKIQLKIAFSFNNSVEALSNKDITPITFDELNPLISEKLQNFCVNLWTDYPQVNQMETDFGTVKDHYDNLIAESNCGALICPFCGIETFEPSESKYREAYDHLNAKAVYPFASINFKLLIPACYKCNSNEKRSTNTLLNDDGTRRSVYNPYDDTIKPEDLQVLIIPKEGYEKKKLETLLRSISWKFELQRNGKSDERLESWDTIYGVKRRFFERLQRLEKEWFYELHSKYKDAVVLGQSFFDFQFNFMKYAKYQILISGMGIIKYSYFNFLFSIPDFEKKLQNITASS